MMPSATPQLGSGASTIDMLKKLRELFAQTGYSGSLEDALRSLASGKTGQNVLADLMSQGGSGGGASTSGSTSSSHPTPIPI